jgi:simple sugar transport system permease protein
MSTSTAPGLPRWVDVVVLPAFSLALALGVAALVSMAVGFEPGQVLALLVKGAFGSRAGIGYTLYYATTFVFTGLAVAVALHGGLFNIGAEGQATVGGLFVGLAALAWAAALPPVLMLPALVLAGALGGALWGAVPGALQAWRGSHVVITTIMFNFVASALLSYLLVNTLKAPGQMAPESAAFADAARMPGLHELLGAVGIEWPRTPLNASVLLAALAVPLVHLLLQRTRAGYALRAVGHAPGAAHYAGIRPAGVTVGTMALSGALAGLVGVNEIAGMHGRLLLDFVAGAGFTGIAVSLIGRNHPVGIVFAALLFGALYQGGAELTFELPGFSRDMVFMLQGLIVLFAGALTPAVAGWLRRGLGWALALRRGQVAPVAAGGEAGRG